MRARSAAVAGAVVAVGAATLMGLTAGIASASGPGECTDNVNVRAEPRIDAPIVALCEAGTAVETGTVRNGFVEITDLGGWAAEEFISIDAAPASAPSSTGTTPSTSSPSTSTPSTSTPSASTPSVATPSSDSGSSDSGSTDSGSTDAGSTDAGPIGGGSTGSGSGGTTTTPAEEDSLRSPGATGPSTGTSDAADTASTGADEPAADEIAPAAPAAPPGLGGLL